MLFLSLGSFLELGVLVDSFDEGGNMVGVHVRVDPVAQVGYPAFSAKLFGHFFDHSVDVFRRRVKGAGVEVALEGDVTTN